MFFLSLIGEFRDFKGKRMPRLNRSRIRGTVFLIWRGASWRFSDRPENRSRCWVDENPWTPLTKWKNGGKSRGWWRMTYTRFLKRVAVARREWSIIDISPSGATLKNRLSRCSLPTPSLSILSHRFNWQINRNIAKHATPQVPGGPSLYHYGQRTGQKNIDDETAKILILTFLK